MGVGEAVVFGAVAKVLHRRVGHGREVEGPLNKEFFIIINLLKKFYLIELTYYLLILMSPS
jgi:hypothetical protein